MREPSEPGAPLTASVFVPARAENYYVRKIEAYRSRETPAASRTKRLSPASTQCASRPRVRCSPTTSACSHNNRTNGSGGKSGCARAVAKCSSAFHRPSTLR